jgi:two-component system, OmpR family, phosphate regulon sensor histidine kinase PhoR
MERRGWAERLLYFALVPAIVGAVLVLGGIALRTTLQIEKARQQTVFDATLTLADERVDRLDKIIIAQDNVVAAHVDLTNLTTIERRWLLTAARETPTVRAIMVLDMDHAEHEVLAFASRAPGYEDDVFRRLLLGRLIPQMNFTAPTEELRHLHIVSNQQSLLVSYWQRSYLDRRYMIVAWHDVPRLVHDVLPRLYGDVDRGNSRMNVIDEEGRIVFGPPITTGEFTVGRPFPTTLYNWRLQMALTSAEELGRKVERQRLLELGMVGFAALVALAGVAIVVIASIKERRLAALKSDFVANVSHELKTPLSLVRMFGEILLADRVPSDEKRRQYLQIIVSESERLTALIENVLDFAKVERGKAAYEFARGDVGEIVARAVDAYRYRAEREDVEVFFQAKEGLLPAMIDARAIELAVINLLDNAFKYARDGGRVDVQVEEVGRFVTVRVADRGPGIERDEQRRIFERFVRGRRAGVKQVRGSGIGLALVKHIAESHGGSVRVVSPIVDGRGSAFVFTIPKLRGSDAAAAEIEGAAGEPRRSEPDAAPGEIAPADEDRERAPGSTRIEAEPRARPPALD